MAHRLTAKGLPCQPPTVSWIRQNPPMPQTHNETRKVLADNLRRLLDSGSGPASQLAAKRKSGVAQATIGRILSGKSAATVKTIESIAHAYGLSAWQLLVPNLDPSNPPVLRAMSKEEQDMYDRLRQAAQDLAKYAPR